MIDNFIILNDYINNYFNVTYYEIGKPGEYIWKVTLADKNPYVSNVIKWYDLKTYKCYYYNNDILSRYKEDIINLCNKLECSAYLTVFPIHKDTYMNKILHFVQDEYKTLPLLDSACDVQNMIYDHFVHTNNIAENKIIKTEDEHILPYIANAISRCDYSYNCIATPLIINQGDNVYNILSNHTLSSQLENICEQDKIEFYNYTSSKYVLLYKS